MTKSIFVFGEVHNNNNSVTHIEKRIREIKPEYLLHELLYTDLCYNEVTIRHRLEKCKIGELCDPGLNKDIYKLGLDLNMKLIGIDLDDAGGLSKLSLPEQFKKREQRMVLVIKKHLELPHNPKLVIVVGDTHLREIGNKELKPSPLVELFAKDERVKVERAPANLQEIP